MVGFDWGSFREIRWDLGTEQALVGALVRIDFPRWLFAGCRGRAGVEQGAASGGPVSRICPACLPAQVLSNKTGWLQVLR